MRVILLVHVLAGGLGLLLGYVALSAAKGAPLHRKSGLLFVYVMAMMSVTGMIVSGVGGVAPAINIPAAALTFYLVITSLTTVRTPAARSRPLDIAAMLFASAGDLRVIRAGGVRGALRLKRHLWRMCFALFIASIAFHTGRGRVPEMFRIPALLTAAVLLPIVAILYWQWRLRLKRIFSPVVGISAPEAI